MTLEERIEVAAKGSFTENSWALLSEETRRKRRNIVALYLTRAFPELFTVPPTGWIAPFEPDDGMIDATTFEAGPVSDWINMRDNYLFRHPMKPTKEKTK